MMITQEKKIEFYSHMSSGYTRVKANIAPAEPAAACPTGGNVSFVTVAIMDEL